jgi:O-antigen ligase
MLLALAICLAAIALLTLLTNPVAGILVLFIVRPVIDTTYATLVVSSFSLTHLVGVISPLLVLGHLLVFKPEEGLGRSPLRLLWLIYAVDIAFFSILIVVHQDWESGASVFFRYLNGVVAFFMIQAYFSHARRLQAFLLAVIMAGLFPIGVGLYQTVHGIEWHYAQAEGLTRQVGLYHDAFTNRFYAMQTILALLLYFALFVRGGPLSVSALAMSLWPAAMLLLKAYSKAGLLTLGIWTLCWTLLRKRYATLAALAAGGAIVGSLYLSSMVSDLGRLFRKEIGALGGTVDINLTFQGRWFGWKEMLERWNHFPLLAKIFGSGETAFGAHNDYLQILFHGGLLGLAIYVTLLAAVGARILKGLRWSRTPLMIAGAMLYLMWLVDAVGLVPSAYPGYQWFVWGLIGLSLRSMEERPSTDSLPMGISGPGLEERESYRGLLQPIGPEGRRYPLLSA